jgi:hypothetical protein
MQIIFIVRLPGVVGGWPRLLSVAVQSCSAGARSTAFKGVSRKKEASSGLQEVAKTQNFRARGQRSTGTIIYKRCFFKQNLLKRCCFLWAYPVKNIRVAELSKI